MQASEFVPVVKPSSMHLCTCLKCTYKGEEFVTSVKQVNSGYYCDNTQKYEEKKYVHKDMNKKHVHNNVTYSYGTRKSYVWYGAPRIHM